MDESITAAEANRSFSQLLRGVREEGASYVVTSHGKPVARLVPIATRTDNMAVREAARKLMRERWAQQPLTVIGSWTRDELYECD